MNVWHDTDRKPENDLSATAIFCSITTRESVSGLIAIATTPQSQIAV